MKRIKSKERNALTSRMEWYFDEATEKKTTGHSETEKRLKERSKLAPHMEYYFDEITDRKYIRCPLTGRKATIEVIRSASRDDTPFIDVAYCSIFGCAPTCKKQCLKQINYMKHLHV